MAAVTDGHPAGLPAEKFPRLGGAEGSNTSICTRFSINAGVALGIALEDVLEEGGALLFVEGFVVGAGQAAVRMFC